MGKKIILGKNISGIGDENKIWYGRTIHDGIGNVITDTYALKSEIAKASGAAADISIADTSGHYESDNVEGALSEIAKKISDGTQDRATIKADVTEMKQKLDDIGSGSGGMPASGARIIVSVVTGATVTCTEENGKLVGKATSKEGKAVFDVSYGTYTIAATYGDTASTSTEVIKINDMRIYYATLLFSDDIDTDEKPCKLVVTGDIGAVITVVNDGSTQIKTIQDEPGITTFDILNKFATVSVTAQKGEITRTQTVKFSSGQLTLKINCSFPKIVALGKAGEVITISKDEKTYTKTLAAEDDIFTVYLPELGVWTVTGSGTTTYGIPRTYTEDINISDYTLYEVQCWRNVYAFHIDGTKSDPAQMITYLEDCKGYTPAKMNYNTNRFDWGSWNRDEFFVPRPCMLKNDGTVDYYLKDWNYAYKAGSDDLSDINNPDYEGNAMMEWGRYGKKIWLKIVPDSNNISATVYISDTQMDDDYHAWSFMDSNGNYVDHFYTPIYNGSLVNNKLRSLSGQEAMAGKNATQEISYAEANNPDGEKIWYTEVYSDILIINMLLLMLGRNMDTQAAFGYGNTNGSKVPTGQLDSNGLFYGTAAANTIGVKVFGMENWWGEVFRRYAGHVTDANGNQLIKMTYSTADGSTQSGYNTTGAGYINSGVACTSNGYITQHKYNNKYGALPSAVANGSATTYYCDYYWAGKGTYAFRGGDWSYGAYCGAFSVHLIYTASYGCGYVGAALSCKPLRKGE